MELHKISRRSFLEATALSGAAAVFSHPTIGRARINRVGPLKRLSPQQRKKKQRSSRPAAALASTTAGCSPMYVMGAW